jgi:tetratricopeptide (TPR) repeat protein
MERYFSAYPGDDADTREAREAIGEELKQLNNLLAGKRPRVERFVRVGCPSRGTTLAAGRLDVYINLLLSGVQLVGAKLLGPKGAAFIGSLRSLAIAVARKRFDDGLLPGIKAMVPDGGMARFLNDPNLRVDADLSVIAGNSSIGDGLRQTLLVALTNLYYWQANDWVVETDAMIGGHPRQVPGVHFVDDGRGHQPVNHFSYFANRRTFNAIVQALAGNHQGLPEFVSLHAQPVKTKSRGERGPRPKCITVMLPGLPGSHLRADGDRVWMHPANIAVGRLHRLDVRKAGRQVIPDGWFPSRYAALAAYLEERGHRVEVFDYDWRLSLPQNSRRLGETLETLAGEAAAESLKLRLLTHSMGGWVSLLWLATDSRGLWDRLCREQDMRLVMAGTPLQGTFDTVQLLAAQHPLLRMLAAVDFKHDRHELVEQFRHYPGLLETLPGAALSGPDWNAFDDRQWAQLATALGKRWKHPEAGALQQAFGVRSRVDIETPPLHGNRVLYLAGQDNATPVGVRAEGKQLRFDYTAEGDGLTPWASTPQWLQDGRCWYLPRVKHGDLFCSPAAFPAIQELLEHGATRLLPQRPPAVARGVGAVPDVDADTPLLFPTEDDLEAAALHGTPPRFGPPVEPLGLCHVRIRHGNIHYADLPVMVGHYQGDGVTGSEAALDRSLGGRLTALHRASLYPGPLNTVEIVVQPGTQRSDGAVVVGLGTLGQLSAANLRETLRHGLIRFGLDHGARLRGTEDSGRDGDGRGQGELALASLVIGSGVGGMPRIDAVKALLEAVADANRQLRELDAPLLQRLDIIELFEDAAIAIAHACERVCRELGDALTVDLAVRSMPGGLQRPFFDEAEPWWRRIQVTGNEQGLDFAPLTDRAGIDVRSHPVQTTLIDRMLAVATANTAADPAIGRSLFELLVPVAFKSQVEAQGGMVLLVDDRAARYPWELLTDRRSRDRRPLATRIGMVRQLYDRSGEPARPTVRNGRALVVGDTEAGDGFPPLPGAVAEASLVAERLNRGGFDAGQPLIRRRSIDIVIALTNHDYQIAHLAGHGVVAHPVRDPSTGEPVKDPITGTERLSTGMLLGDGIVLGAEEIQALPCVPELVFLNCCYLGANREPPPGGPRHTLAANLGTAFIRAGAKCVIAAGWAVDDAAAASFAETFYEAMLSGSTFGEAVTRARKAVFDAHGDSDTWGAYQCYGDYAFRLRAASASPIAPVAPGPAFHSPREIEIEASNIRNEIYTARMGSDALQPLDPDARLRYLGDLLEEQPHLNTGAACAAIGAAWQELGDFAQSVAWSERAITCEDGGATLKTLEGRVNALARLAERCIAAASPDASPEILVASLEEAREIAGKALELADTLVGMGETAERAGIRARAYKHHGILHAALASALTDEEKAAAARERARDSLVSAYAVYRTAADRALAVHGRLDSYPLLNAVGLWLYLARQAGRVRKVRDALKAMDTDSVLAELDQLADQFAAQPPAEGAQRFWERTDRINREVLRSLVCKGLHRPPSAPQWRQLAARYREAFQRGSPRERDSVTKQLRLLVLLLGTGAPELRALAELYREVSSG